MMVTSQESATEIVSLSRRWTLNRASGTAKGDTWVRGEFGLVMAVQKTPRLKSWLRFWNSKRRFAGT